MAISAMGKIVDQLRQAATVPYESTDEELLAAFVERRERAALEALIHRHGPMVFGVCRRMLGNHHDAEDVFHARALCA
jgi:hypothetical protein